MTDIASNVNKIESTLPANVKLVAVSKYHPVSAIEEAYGAGHRLFGESRMQELDEKQKLLPKDIEWHFIGHLQTNKVKSIVPYVHTIHSVDSWKLLNEIEKQASQEKRIVNCLIEIHIAQEDSKHGLSPDGYKQFFDNKTLDELQWVHITGVMGMATNTDDEEQIRSEFGLLSTIFNELKCSYFKEKDYFSEISMGMSHDYKIGVEKGATIIRLGSAIFGDR